MIPIIYYAHSMKIYGSERERKELRRLREEFPKGCIWNPNRPYIQGHKNPMGACLNIVKDAWIAGIAFSHDNRKIPSGVYDEIQAAKKNRKTIYIIESDRIRIYYGNIKLTKKDRATDWAEV